jgi:hypothetical protein
VGVAHDKEVEKMATQPQREVAGCEVRSSWFWDETTKDLGSVVKIYFASAGPGEAVQDPEEAIFTKEDGGAREEEEEVKRLMESWMESQGGGVAGLVSAVPSGGGSAVGGPPEIEVVMPENELGELLKLCLISTSRTVELSIRTPNRPNEKQYLQTCRATTSLAMKDTLPLHRLQLSFPASTIVSGFSIKVSKELFLAVVPALQVSTL